MVTPIDHEFDELFLQEERIRQYTYSPVRRWVQRAKALLGTVVPGILGFDVSAWQTFVDFVKAKGAGLGWVYIRGLYGLTVDGKFFQHFTGAEGVMPRTAYLYYKDSLNPIQQAQKLYATCLASGDPGDYQPVLDLESIGNPVLTAWRVKACLEELARLFGKVPLLYSGYYIIRDALKGDKSFLASYMLIIAAYPLAGWTDDLPQRVLNYPPMVPAPFTMWTANPDENLIGKVVGWQFTSSAPADAFGATGYYLDLDWCSPAFAKQVLGGGGVVPPPGGEILNKAECLIAGLKIRKTPVALPDNSNKIGSLALGQEVLYVPAWTVVPNTTDEWWAIPNPVPGYAVGYVAAAHSTLTGPGMADLGAFTP